MHLVFALIVVGSLMCGTSTRIAPAMTQDSASQKTDAGQARYEDPFDASGNFVKPEALAGLEAQYEARPTDAQLRDELVAATISLADGVMYKSPQPPNRKYPTALRLYRAALKLDPENERAREAKVLIEDIYKSLGKPVPDAR